MHNTIVGGIPGMCGHLAIGRDVGRISPADSLCHVIMPDFGGFHAFTRQTTPVTLRVTGGV